MKNWKKQILASLVLTVSLSGCADAASSSAANPSPQWKHSLAKSAEQIDAAMPGNLGLYIKRLGESSGVYEYGGGRKWYLSSTIKVPLAIAVLERVDRGQLDLNEQLTLRQSDFVDGAGDLIWQKPGAKYTIAQLIEKSLQNSDSVATDMLIRHIGEPELNRRVQAWTGGGFSRITTILQVRYDAYGALHPGVARLSNMQIVELRNSPAGEPRLQALANELGVPRAALKASDLESVFERYYQRGDNTATLSAFATLLEKLVTGQLLSEQSTERMLNHMRKISTGDKRISAGLPKGADFAQKTGTQIGRACNVGALNSRAGRDGAVIVVACAEQFKALSEAESAFQQLGAALAEAELL